MHRFFVAPELLQGTTSLALPDKLAHQVRDVLHIKEGERLVLLDNSGDEYVCMVAKSARGLVEVTMQERRRGQREPAVRVILCQGMMKSARFEWVLEKGTELGVSVFAPVLCQRSLSGLEDTGPAKVQRWQRIIQEAAEQCGRSRLPALLPMRPLARALDELPATTLALMPWEAERGQHLRDSLRVYREQAGKENQMEPKTVFVFIGPEGGLTKEEVHLAQRHGVHVVSLGSLILRAETAALATVANVMYEVG